MKCRRGQIGANARKNVMKGFVQESWSSAKINVNLKKRIVTNLSTIGQTGFKANVLKHVVPESLLENTNV